MNRRISLILFVIIFIIAPLRSETVRFGDQAVQLKNYEGYLETCVVSAENYSIKTIIGSPNNLAFSYGVKPEGWSGKGTQEFLFKVNLENKAGQHILFSKALRPGKKNKDQGWHHEDVSLNAYIGQEVVVRFECDVISSDEKNDEKIMASAVWANQIILPLKAHSKKTNIILISLDTLRPDRLGINGYFRATSPEIDSLAKEGVFFKQAISESSWTKPAHFSLFTSLFPTSHGLKDVNDRTSELSWDNTTLTEVLKKQGYKTQAFTGSANMSAIFGYYHGFDSYVETNQQLKSDASFIFGKGMRWLEENANKPFFLFLHTYEIHKPYIHKHYLKGAGKLSKIDELNARYDSGILFTDKYVGDLKRKLEELNLTQKTILVIVSDHGDELFQRGYRDEHGHTLYDELIRIPMLFYAPFKLKPRMINQFQAQLTDVAPTLLSALNIKHDSYGFQGRDLWPMLLGGVVPVESTAYSEAVNRGPEQKSARNLKSGIMGKLIYSPEVSSLAFNYKKGIVPVPKKYANSPWVADLFKRGGVEFYDLSKDPSEKQDVKSENQSQVKNLIEITTRFFKTLPVSTLLIGQNLAIPEGLIEKLKSLGY